MRDCPFCGASPTRLRIIDKWTGKGAYRKRVSYVRCLKCNARGPTVDFGATFDVRNERPDAKRRIEIGALAAMAWDGKPTTDPNDFMLESVVI